MNKYIQDFGYKLVCVDDKYSNLLNSYLGQGTVHKFINNMLEEIKYYSDMIKNHLNTELVMTKKLDEDFNNSIEY